MELLLNAPRYVYLQKAIWYNPRFPFLKNTLLCSFSGSHEMFDLFTLWHWFLRNNGKGVYFPKQIFFFLPLFWKYFFPEKIGMFYRDNYKTVQNVFKTITIFYFFPLLDSWGPGTLPPGGGDLRTPKTPSRKQHPNIYFWYFHNST